MLFTGGPQSLYPLAGLTCAVWLWCAWRGWRASALRAVHPVFLLGATALWYPLAQDLVVFLIGVVVGLTLVRLTSLSRSQAFTQLYILSFAQVTLSAQLEGGLSYGLLLTCYMVMITVGLTLNHLRAQLEVEPEAKRLMRRLSSERLLPERFIWRVGIIATALCALSLALFFMLPRVSGQWFHGYQREAGVAGFSDEVALGAVNQIQKDSRVAFRVTVSRPAPRSPLLVGSPLSELELEKTSELDELLPLEERYWVGRRLDRYEVGRWSQRAPNIAQRFAPLLSPLQGDTHWLSSPTLYSESLRARLVWQELFLEHRGHEALFSLAEPLAVILPRSNPVRPLKVTEDQSLQYRWEGSFRYQVLSLRPKHGPLLTTSLARYRAAAERLPHYGSLTQIPTEIEARVFSLTAPLVASSQSVGEVVKLLTEHLQREYRYSLEGLEVDGRERDPVLYFLEERRAGHCEYFSSALTLMLRSLGLPARVVTGYRGGEWNEYGAYLTVYQRDAHAWVELWAGGDPLLPSSWVRYDPTPEREGSEAQQSAWSRWLDQLEFTWLRYVVGFEAQDQVKALHKAEGEVSAWTLSLRRWWLTSTLRRGLLSAYVGLSESRITPLIGGLIALLSALVALTVWLKRSGLSPRRLAVRRAQTSAQSASSVLYLRAIKACERAGLTRPAEATTGGELLSALELRSAETYAQLKALTLVYERLRFGPTRRGAGGVAQEELEELEELKRLVDQLERSLSSPDETF